MSRRLDIKLSYELKKGFPHPVSQVCRDSRRRRNDATTDPNEEWAPSSLSHSEVFVVSERRDGGRAFSVPVVRGLGSFRTVGWVTDGGE